MLHEPYLRIRLQAETAFQKIALIGFLCLVTSAGCSLKPGPGVALQEVRFTVPPYIVKRGDDYYLRYRIATEPGGLNLLMVLCSRKEKNKGYYYFSISISHSERGNLVERPLANDQFTEFANRKAVYWLNPDGSMIPLKIKGDAEAASNDD